MPGYNRINEDVAGDCARIKVAKTHDILQTTPKGENPLGVFLTALGVPILQVKHCLEFDRPSAGKIF